MLLALLLAAATTYDEAYCDAIENKKPLLVFVKSDWCGPCRTAKRTILPELERRGVLKKVAFAVVDVEADRELYRKLTSGGIPQFLLYEYKDGGLWKRRVWIGVPKVDDLVDVIDFLTRSK